MNPQDDLTRVFPPGTRVVISLRYHGVVVGQPMQFGPRSIWMIRVRCDDGNHRYGSLRTMNLETTA